MKYWLSGMLLFVVAGCGGGAVTHQNQAPQTPASKAKQADSNATTPAVPVKPKGPSLAAEYAAAVKAAEAAVQALIDNPSGETYAIAGARCYDVKRIELDHKSNGQDVSLLRRRSHFNSNTWINWKKDLYGRVPLNERNQYEQHPEYVAAKKAFKEAGGED